MDKLSDASRAYIRKLSMTPEHPGTPMVLRVECERLERGIHTAKERIKLYEAKLMQVNEAIEELNKS